MYMRETLKVHSQEFSSCSQWLNMTDPTLFLPFVPRLDDHQCALLKWYGNFPDISHSFILMYLLFFSVEGRSVITVMFQLFFCCCYMDWFYNWNPFTEPIFFIGNLIASAFLCSMVCHCMYALSVPWCVHVKMFDQSLWVLWLFYVPIFMATSRAFTWYFTVTMVLHWCISFIWFFKFFSWFKYLYNGITLYHEYYISQGVRACNKIYISLPLLGEENTFP